MTSKERVLRAIAFQPPADLIPLWQTGFFEQFTKNWRQRFPDYKPTPDEQYGVDTTICIGDEGFFPSQARVVDDDGEYVTQVNSWGVLSRNRRGAYFENVLRRPLENKEDLDKLVFEPAELPGRWKDFERHMQYTRERSLCGFAKIGGLYVRAHFIRGEAELLLDMLEDEGFCNELFDRLTDYFSKMALEVLRRGDLWDAGLWIFDDMAATHTPMFSPKCFEKYLLPRYAKLIRTVKEAGCSHVYLHSDGDIRPLLDMMLEAGIEGFNPLEPRSGLDLVEMRKKYGKRMVFFGGVCNTQILPRGDKEEIRRHIEPLVEVAKEGGVVLGLSSLAEDTPPEAYDYYMKLIGR